MPALVRLRQLLGAVILLSVQAAPTVAASEIELTAEERAWLEEHESIRMGPDPSGPPLEFFDEDGKYSGIASDYAALIEQRLGIRFQIEKHEKFSEVVESTKRGEIDLWMAAVRTDERTGYLLFTEPYVQFRAVIIVREDERRQLDLEDLAGLRVAGTEGYASVTWLREQVPEIELIAVPSTADGLTAVSFGAADAIVVSDALASYYIEELSLTNLRVAGHLDYVWELSIASRKDWPILHRILQKTLNSIVSDERRAISRRWSSVEEPSRSRSRWLLPGLVFGALALSIAVIWYVKRRRALAEAPGARESRGSGAGSAWAMFMAAAAVAATLGLNWWMQGLIERRAREDVGRALQGVLNTTSKAVHHWFREREEAVLFWTRHPQIDTACRELLATAPTPEALRTAPAQAELRKQLGRVLDTRVHDGYMLLSPEGRTIATDSDEELGSPADKVPSAFLSRLLAGTQRTAISLPQGSVVTTPGQDRTVPTMLVGAAVTGGGDEVLGVLAFRLGPEADFTEILQRGRMGESGESYAFNREAQLVSESRFDEDLRKIGLVAENQRGILSVQVRDPGGNLITGFRTSVPRPAQPLTLMAREAIGGRPGMSLEGYNDYRGVPVIGAWVWDETDGLGIATEIDMEEAYRSLRTVRRLFQVATGFTILLIVALTWMFVRNRRMIGVSLEKLQQANEELEGTSSVILRWAPDGTVLHLNRFGQELFDFSAAEIVGKPLIGTIVPPSESRKRDVEQWIDDLETDPEHQHESSEHQNQRKNGDLVWMAWRNRLIRNPDQSLKEVLAIGIDITERKAAEQKLEAVSESAVDAIVIADSSDTVVGWNRAAETILGWPPDEMLGRPLQTLIPERYRAAHRAGMDRVNQTGLGRVLGKTMELAALHREGHEVEIELSLSTWLVASERFFTGIIRDITERRKMEAALKRSYDAVTAAHARMKKDLDAAARVQQSLLPASLPESDRVQIAWQYHPCDELAGDSLNVHRLGPRHISLYVVDVSGHGVPAALLSVSVARSLEPSMDPSCLVTDSGDAVTSPADVARRLNTLYPMENYNGHYFTMVYGVLDLETGRFRFITAGHPGPILVRPGAPPKQVVAPALMIGALEGVNFSDSEVQLAAGDRLYLFSDGLYEEINDAEEQFELSRLMESLASRADESLDASLEAVRQDLVAWHGDDDFTDDFSILAVEILGT